MQVQEHYASAYLTQGLSNEASLARWSTKEMDWSSKCTDTTCSAAATKCTTNYQHLPRTMGSAATECTTNYQWLPRKMGSAATEWNHATCSAAATECTTNYQHLPRKMGSAATECTINYQRLPRKMGSVATECTPNYWRQLIIYYITGVCTVVRSKRGLSERSPDRHAWKRYSLLVESIKRMSYIRIMMDCMVSERPTAINRTGDLYRWQLIIYGRSLYCCLYWAGAQRTLAGQACMKKILSTSKEYVSSGCQTYVLWWTAWCQNNLLQSIVLQTCIWLLCIVYIKYIIDYYYVLNIGCEKHKERTRRRWARQNAFSARPDGSSASTSYLTDGIMTRTHEQWCPYHRVHLWAL